MMLKNSKNSENHIFCMRNKKNKKEIMKIYYYTSIMLLGVFLVACSSRDKKNTAEEQKVAEDSKSWVIGTFVRPEGKNPVIRPIKESTFFCPIRKEVVRWEERDVFNPAATVKDGKIVVLYRAEDASGEAIGTRTSRIGYAESVDGIAMTRRGEPVLYPAEDVVKTFEWPGGCEDPRVAMTEDGLYVMLYTAWNRKVAQLAVATSRDLIKWEKHGLAFEKAYNGRFVNTWSKAAAPLTKIKDEKIVLEKVDGKYFMYWGEHAVFAATSTNLTDWTPVLDENNELLKIIETRKGYFDSDLTECGPPALMTKDGIVLIYNGKNGKHDGSGDPEFAESTYTGGQLLLDAKNPLKVLDRLGKPFYYPVADFEKSGQYKDGTVFLEGLAYLKNKLYLYYGTADSQLAVAICDYKP